jgi:hypothetical protein
MTTTTRPAVARLVLGALLHAASALGQETGPPVAIVCALTGTASLTVPAEQRTTALRLFDWLRPGSIVEIAPDSSLTIVFSNGVRYELGGTARATTGTNTLDSSSGPVRQLEPVPPLPRLAPIAEGARTGPRYAAIRIRGGTIGKLYPDLGAATLAESTVLRFDPVPDASRYRVDVQTESGVSVFQVETQSPAVSVSPGILKPGEKYYWDVRTLDRIGQAARGAAEFVTLTEEAANARAVLKRSLERADDVASLALLAEVDRGLGLLIEAREQFREALKRYPGDAGLRHTLDRLEQQLADPREK